MVCQGVGGHACLFVLKDLEYIFRALGTDILARTSFTGISWQFIHSVWPAADYDSSQYTVTTHLLGGL